MVDSTSDAIIADPKTVISKLFDASLGQEKPDIGSDFDIPKTFKSSFATKTQVEKIPRLDTIPISALKTGKLVRFVGMVQDTSYSQEIYVGMTRDQTKWSLHRYGEAVHIDVDALKDADKVLDERNGIYVTSIPGAARWLESSDSLESLSLEDNNALKGDKDRIVAQGQKEIGILVKCYSRTENETKVCDLVEVIGILEVPDEDSGDENGLVIHAVTLEKKNLNDLVLSQRETLSTADLAKAKDLVIRHMASLFQGDTLAAQSVLLNLTSCLTHRHPVPLGSLPMNIYSTPPDLIANLIAFLRSVLPALSLESLSVDALNSSCIYPKSDGDKLCAGRGQFVSGTVLLINDTMQEGKLQDTGVRNLRFLSRIAVAQKLSFEFPYHEFDVDTDIPLLVLGASKTLLPVAISFPHVKGDAVASSLTQGDLELLRCYLAQISTLNISIDPSTAATMQDDFVKKRKDAGVTAIDETWFGTRIVVAKGITRNNGREVVTPRDWQESLEICSQWEARRK